MSSRIVFLVLWLIHIPSFAQPANSDTYGLILSFDFSLCDFSPRELESHDSIVITEPEMDLAQAVSKAEGLIGTRYEKPFKVKSCMKGRMEGRTTLLYDCRETIERCAKVKAATLYNRRTFGYKCDVGPSDVGSGFAKIPACPSAPAQAGQGDSEIFQ